MSYVAVQVPDAAELASAADAGWQRVLAARPDLAPAVGLQRLLLAELIALADALGRHPLPRLSLPPKYLAAKLARGVPAFSGEPIPLPVPLLKTSLLRLCAALAEGGAGDVATHISTAVEDRTMDAGALFTASLGRNQEAIRQGAVHRGLSPDLLWLVGELTVGPAACALQRTLLAAADGALRDALGGWTHGYCPACGSWPALAEVVEGRRILRCSFCAAGWELATRACVYCRTAGDAFVTSAPDPGKSDRRVETCGACGGYLKVMDVPALSPFPLLSISDLDTMDLDTAAMEQGFRRPVLAEIKAKG